MSNNATTLLKLIVPIVVAMLVGLGSWNLVASVNHGERLVKVETQQENDRVLLQEVHDDLKRLLTHSGLPADP
jgi:hypothetical protein